MSDDREHVLHVRGTSIPWSVTDQGRFVGEYDGRRFTAETLELLKQQLTRATKQTIKMAIPATLIEKAPGWDSDDDRLVRVVVTGRHAGHGRPLLRSLDGKAYTPDHDRNEFLTELSDDDLNRGATLLGEYLEAKEQWEKFKSRRFFDVQKAIREAQDAVS